MKYLAAAASGLLATFAALLLLSLATMPCAASSTVPPGMRPIIFAVLCVIALAIGFTIFRATLHRLSDDRNYPGPGPTAH